MEQERLTYLFQKFANQNCTDEELREFMDFVNLSGNSDKLEVLMDDFWQRSPEVELDKNKSDIILERVFAASESPIRRSYRKTLRWLGWAAALILLCSAILLLVQPAPLNADLVENRRKPVKQASQSAALITVNSINEHQRIILPDSSIVILNTNSSLTYSRIFSGKREVSLKGEGYFDIKHDKKNSFIVYTGKIRTTVLGTAFNIRAYDKDRTVEVTVTRGKVGVVGEKSTLGILKANQQIVINKQLNHSDIKQVVAKNIVQWQGNDLYFEDVSMEEAAAVLSQKFNTPISFGSEQAKKCTFSATFLKGESLTEILKIICTYNNAEYQTRAGGITINGKGCN